MKRPFQSSRFLKDFTRRDFIKASGGCAALSSASVLSTILNLQATNAAVAATNQTGGYKALVCFFAFGGWDSWNILTPNGNQYDDYALTRGPIAIPQNELLPVTDSSGRSFGIHPELPAIRDLYNSGKIGFVANTGSLIQPTSLSDYQNRRSLPLGTFSHADMIRHWQTSVPQSRTHLTGWAGRMADILSDTANTNSSVSMNIALNATNIFETGDSIVPYVVGRNGATTLSGYDPNGDAEKRILTRTTDRMLEQTYRNLFEQTHASIRRVSIDAAFAFNDATSSVDLDTVFPTTGLGQDLKMVARTIGARQTLGQSRQIFFVNRGGWDHHAQVLENQDRMLPEVNDAVKAFHDAMVELTVDNDVTFFSMSDFARTLQSNSNEGSDHAWGGNCMVMGGSVKGGDVHGSYPLSIATGNDLDVGRGRMLPTTAVDEYAAELAMWFGVENDNNMEAILPNIRNFLAHGDSAPIGFMNS